MGKNKNKKISELYQIGFSNINEKYVMPIDEFDVQFLQLNYNKYRVRNNDHVVPVWSVQRNTFDNSYYEFEIVAESDEKSQSHVVSDPARKMSNEISTSNKNIISTVTKLNTADKEIDFTTYMKLVNVFKESHTAIAGNTSDKELQIDYVVIDQGNQEKSAKSEDTNTDLFVILRVLSGEKLKVSMSNFHGFWTSGDGVQCRVCLVMVDDVEAHKMEIQHMKRIANTFNNVHCIRKIGPILNHCVLCNEIIENIEFHLKTNAAHAKHLETSLKRALPKIANTNANQLKNSSNQTVVCKSAIQTVKIPTDIAYCKVCDRKMHIKTLKSHEKGKQHKTMLDKKMKRILKKQRHEDEQSFNNNVQIQHTYTNNAVDVAAKANSIVDAEKFKYLKIDAAHTKQLTYLKALKLISKYQPSGVCTASSDNTVKRDLISTPEISYNNADQPLNDPSQMSVKKSVATEKRSVVNIDTSHSISKSVENTKEKADLKCEIGPTSVLECFHHKFQDIFQRELHNCNGDKYDEVLLNCLIKTFSELTQTYTNKKNSKGNVTKKADTNAVNVKIKTMEEKKKESVENTKEKSDLKFGIGSTSILESCQHRFPENLETAFHNCKGDRHDDASINSLIIGFSKLAQLYVNGKNNNNFTKKVDLKYLMDKNTNHYFHVCKICHVDVPKTDKHVLDHVNGAKHKKEYKLFLNCNKIRYINEHILFCEVCKMFMSVDSELIHIKMIRHRKSMVIQSPVYGEVQ